MRRRALENQGLPVLDAKRNIELRQTQSRYVVRQDWQPELAREECGATHVIDVVMCEHECNELPTR